MNEATDGATLHVQLLGDFRLDYRGEAVTGIDAPRLQSLFAFLLLHRAAPQSRHHLAFVLWPDSPEDQALTNLRNLLYHLRRELPDADRLLHVDRNTVQWRSEAPFDLDVHRFEGALSRADAALRRSGEGVGSNQDQARRALEDAVSIYGGDLVPSCYEDWIEPERERLRQAFERSLERLVRLLENQREYREAIRHAQRLLRHDPLRESAYRHLMRLQAVTGDRAGALRTYHRCSTALVRELGVEPSPATREVYERLVAAEEMPELPSRPPRRVAPISPLVGRDRAWTELRGAWQEAVARQSHLALISGESGIGKTRLAEELVLWASRQGIVTAVARCYPSGGELTYGPVAAWLRALPLTPLQPVWKSEVARIVPEMAAGEPEVSAAGHPAKPWERQRFFEALARATLSAGEPLLLLLDAVQWCDRGSLEWLQYLLRFDRRARLLVVGTYRAEEVADDHVLTSMLHQLRRDERLTEVELAALSKEETGTLARHLAGRDLSTNLVNCLYHETEGNPLFVAETVRAGLPDEVQELPSGGFKCLPRPLPTRMRDALMARLDQLSPLARSFAELAATIGRDFTFRVLTAASDAGEDRVVQGLDELWRAQIVREHGEDGYDFSHDKLREVTYAEVSEARRRMLHRRVARALESVHAEDPDSVAGQVAAHYERADELREAAAYYERAAEAARSMQSEEDAARYLRRASRLAQESPQGESVGGGRAEARPGANSA